MTGKKVTSAKAFKCSGRHSYGQEIELLLVEYFFRFAKFGFEKIKVGTWAKRLGHSESRGRRENQNPNAWNKITSKRFRVSGLGFRGLGVKGLGFRGLGV